METPIEAAAAPPAAASVETPAAPEAAPVAPAQPDFTQQIQEGIGQQLADILGDPADYEQPQQSPEYDPFDPNSVGQLAQAQIDAALQERLSPYEPYLQKLAQDQSRAQVMADFDKIAPEVGDFDREDALRRGMVLSNQGMDYTQAIRQAATESAADKKVLVSSGQTPVVEAIKTHGAAAVDAYFKANPDGNVSGITDFIAALQAANGQPPQPGAPASASPASENAWDAPHLSVEDRIRAGVQDAVDKRTANIGVG